MFQQECTEALWVESALALRESGWWIQNTMNVHRIVKVLAKEADTILVSQLHSLHSSSLFPCLCSSHLRCCVKKSARKKDLSWERCMTYSKHHQVLQACTNIPATWVV